MIHFIEISDRAAHLHVTEGHLTIHCLDGSEHAHAFDDVDALILAAPVISLTGAVFSECGLRRIPIVSCDATYRPVAVQTPLCLEGAEHDAMLEAQISAPKPLRKHLWKDIVKAKIQGQDAILKTSRNDDSLALLPSQVLSGDSGNIEGLASRIYWRQLALFPRRDRLAQDANILFNYAYTIIFSAFARYVCAASLHPHLGIHHHNQYNPFCLASDLMEPYRACADNAVLELIAETGETTLTRQNREFLIRRLYADSVRLDGKGMPLFEAIRRTTSSFKQCLLAQKPSFLLLPKWNSFRKEA